MDKSLPVFPKPELGVPFDDPDNRKYTGMTMREYFAGLAMQTMARDLSDKSAAEVAVRLADALLAELAKEEGA